MTRIRVERTNEQGTICLVWALGVSEPIGCVLTAGEGAPGEWLAFSDDPARCTRHPSRARAVGAVVKAYDQAARKGCRVDTATRGGRGGVVVSAAEGVSS